MKSTHSDPIFVEIQKFRQMWLLLIVFGIAAIFWYGAFVQIVMRRPFGDNPAPTEQNLTFTFKSKL
jgi:hypothetical protein